MSRPDDMDDPTSGALRSSDAEWVDGDEPRSAARLLTEVFRGRNRHLAIGGAIVNSALFVAAIFCGIRFVNASDARATALWGIAMLLAFGLLISIKIWYWLEMNRLAVMREVKRVELRVARMSERLRD